MSKTRLSRRAARAVDIDHSDIKYDTTCTNIVPGGLPLTLACEICHGKLDIHTKKVVNQIKSRDKSMIQINANNIG